MNFEKVNVRVWHRVFSVTPCIAHSGGIVKVDVLNLRPILQPPGGCLFDRWTYKPVVSHCHFGKRYCNPPSGQPRDHQNAFHPRHDKTVRFFPAVMQLDPVHHENWQVKSAYMEYYIDLILRNIFIFGTLQVRILIIKNSNKFLQQ